MVCNSFHSFCNFLPKAILTLMVALGLSFTETCTKIFLNNKSTLDNIAKADKIPNIIK